MEEPEKIRGKARSAIFEELYRDRITLKVIMLGTDYERLTIVTGIMNQDGIPYFRMDTPRDFRGVLKDNLRLYFEFTGRDRLLYSFRTSDWGMFFDEIWIKFPRVIERIQRRSHFRLGAPMGAKINFKVGKKEHGISVVDVSLGGALLSEKSGQRRGAGLERDSTIRNIELSFPSQDEDLSVKIKRSIVKRVERDHVTGNIRYALQFTDMERDQEKFLNDLLYRFQRGELRKRGGLEQ